MTLSVRFATSADLPAIVAIEKDAVTAAHWSAQQYRALLSPERTALIIEEDGCVQGFVIARVIGEEWEIENLAVAAAARRRGLGTRLMKECLDLARSRGAAAVFLEVRESNHAARALYEKWSFLKSGRRRRYYHDPQEDAILYRLGFK